MKIAKSEFYKAHCRQEDQPGSSQNQTIPVINFVEYNIYIIDIK